MKIKFENTGIQAAISENFDRAGLLPVVFLHGFTGSSTDWSFILNKLPSEFRACALDLPGHGNSPSPDDLGYYTSRNLISILKSSLENLNLHNIVLVGYSMGGRAAIAFASEFPGMISGLILESCTAGIEDNLLRDERIKSDSELAGKIREEGIRKFIDEWYSQALFDSLRKSKTFLRIKEERYFNSAAGLANSLLSFGTGTMPSLWHKLGGFNFPVLLISGETDQKYYGIMKRMNSIIENSQHSILAECGHAAHLEKPEDFINLVNRFLTEKI